MGELPVAAGPASSEEGVEEAAEVALAAQSDNEGEQEASTDEPTPKFRRLSCSEPPPYIKVGAQQAAGAIETVRGSQAAAAGAA